MLAKHINNAILSPGATRPHPASTAVIHHLALSRRSLFLRGRLLLIRLLCPLEV